jgi:hypothetical protein
MTDKHNDSQNSLATLECMFKIRNRFIQIRLAYWSNNVYCAINRGCVKYNGATGQLYIILWNVSSVLK